MSNTRIREHKFNVGDLVCADGGEARITEIHWGADSDWNTTASYTVTWDSTSEWGVFEENELIVWREE